MICPSVWLALPHPVRCADWLRSLIVAFPWDVALGSVSGGRALVAPHQITRKRQSVAAVIFLLSGCRAEHLNQNQIMVLY